MSFRSKVIQFRTIALVTTVVTLLLVALVISGQSHTAITPEPRDSEFWNNRFDEINRRMEQGNVELLFVGDSITHFWEGTIYPADGQPHGTAGQAVWDEYYGGRNAANIGIGGDRTEHVLWRLEHGNVDGISPDLCVVMIGSNNFRSNTSGEIAEGIVAIVESLLAKLPDTEILLLGIFPRGTGPNEIRAMLAEASDFAAAAVADNDRVHYMNIGAKFLTDDGTLPADVMPDALHPNENGYRIWAEAIEGKVSELLGE